MSVLPASEPESSSTIASGSPSRWIVDALHIAVAAMVSTKAIKTAIILRLLIGPLLLHPTHNVHEVKGRGAKDCNEKRREKETRKRKQQFDSGFLRFLFSTLASLCAQ